MKNQLTILLFAMAGNTIASEATYRFDDVDGFLIDEKVISVEDVRDGFESVRGINVDEDSISISSETQAKIIFRNSKSNFLRPSSLSVKIGGDGGGG